MPTTKWDKSHFLLWNFFFFRVSYLYSWFKILQLILVLSGLYLHIFRVGSFVLYCWFNSTARANSFQDLPNSLSLSTWCLLSSQSGALHSAWPDVLSNTVGSRLQWSPLQTPTALCLSTTFPATSNTLIVTVFLSLVSRSEPSSPPWHLLLSCASVLPDKGHTVYICFLGSLYPCLNMAASWFNPSLQLFSPRKWVSVNQHNVEKFINFGWEVDGPNKMYVTADYIWIKAWFVRVEPPQDWPCLGQVASLSGLCLCPHFCIRCWADFFLRVHSFRKRSG